MNTTGQQPDDIIAASGEAAIEDMAEVDDKVLPSFAAVAKRLIESRGAEAALCAALACMTGHTKALQARSLLSNSDGYVTLVFKSDKPISYMAYVWGALKRKVDAEATENIRGMQICADQVSTAV
jgi:GUCT (NUC152) domain